MLSEKIVLIGGGGHCRSVADTLIRTGRFSDIVITDCKIAAGTEVLGCKIVGTDDRLPALYGEGYRQAFITLGSIKSADIRISIYQTAHGMGFSFPFLVDPSAVVADSVRIGKGAFVGKNAIVNTEAVISDFAIINSGAIVEHECKIGKFVHIAVGAVICGGTQIEDHVFVGANATVIQGVRIGKDSIVGAGSTVLADVPANTRVTGVWR